MTTDLSSERKERFVFYVDPQDRRELERLSAQSGAPLAELMRRSLQCWLGQQKQVDDK
jgi:hypothetical protein